MAMLMTGHAVVYVAKQLTVPKQTVSRWKKESDALLQDSVRSSPKLQAVVRELRAALPGLMQNGTKKSR